MPRSRASFSASLTVCVLFLISTVWVIMNTDRWGKRQLLEWDVEAYHQYLPAVFIHHDLLDMRYLQRGHEYIVHPDFTPSNGIFMVPATRHACNKYTCGTAVFQLPYFLIAQGACTLFAPQFATDGNAPPYQLAVAISSALWACIGLMVLARFLLRYLPDLHTALALAAIGFGTNLFFYSSFSCGMAHPYLFFLFALVVERTDAWYREPKLGSALVLGTAIGLVALTRPVDALVAIVPLAWWVDSREGRRRALALFRKHRVHLLLAGVVAFLCVLPQLLYWKAATGHFLFYSYRSERFNFNDPHILEGLFSFRKGWFVYTPLAFVCFLGLLPLWRARATRSYAVMLVVFLLPFLYVVFSWWSWWYGGSFGCRPMIEALALLALPLGVLIRNTLNGGRWKAITLCTVLFLGVGLNLFQQWQYISGIIHYEEMTAERYWLVFGRTDRDALPPFP